MSAIEFTPSNTGSMPHVTSSVLGSSTNVSLQLDGSPCHGVVDTEDEGSPSLVCNLERGGSNLGPPKPGEAVNVMPESGESGTSPTDHGRQPVCGLGVAQAVIGAAQELARMTQFPGVADLAGLVIILIGMLTDKSDIIGGADNMIKRCRSLMFLLQRAANVLEEVRGDL